MTADWGVVSMPEWAVCYLEYGDTGDLSEEDLRLADEWRDRIDKQAVEAYGETAIVSFSYGNNDGYFTSSPEFGLPCNCVDCRLTVFAER